MFFNEFLIFTGYTLCFGTDLSISMSHSVGEEWSVFVNPGDGTGEEALDTWVIRRLDNVNEEASEDTESSEITEEDENKLKIINIEDHKYICFCGYQSMDVRDVFKHIDGHKNWRNYIEAETSPTSGNVHLNPSWRKQLRENFESLVIQRCSADTQEAWRDKDENLNKAKFTEIRCEIIKKLVESLHHIHGQLSTPSFHTIEEVINETLSSGYPFMFKLTEAEERDQAEFAVGYGRGGELGLKNLHKQIWQKLYNKQMEERKQALQSGESLKKGNFPATFGIDCHKYYGIPSDDQRLILKSTENEEDFTAREIIYSRNRAALSEEIRNSQKNISNIIRGFWNSPVHLHQQFIWTTNGIGDLRSKIRKNWKKMISDFLEYITLKDGKSRKILPRLQEIQSRVLTDFDGVNTALEVEIVREVTTLLDKQGEGRSLVLKEGEDPVPGGSPYLLMRELPNR